MFMVIRLPCTYLCIFFAVLVRLCISYCCVANRCVYSAECDGCACRECHVHCSKCNDLAEATEAWDGKKVTFIVRPDGVRVASDNGIF